MTGIPSSGNDTPEPRALATVGTDHRGWCNLDRSVDWSVPSPGPASGDGDSSIRVENLAAADPRTAPREVGHRGSGTRHAPSARGANTPAGDLVGCGRTRDRFPGAAAGDGGRQPGHRQDAAD